jgi:hypothetical protein
MGRKNNTVELPRKRKLEDDQNKTIGFGPITIHTESIEQFTKRIAKYGDDIQSAAGMSVYLILAIVCDVVAVLYHRILLIMYFDSPHNSGSLRGLA